MGRSAGELAHQHRGLQLLTLIPRPTPAITLASPRVVHLLTSRLRDCPRRRCERSDRTDLTPEQWVERPPRCGGEECPRGARRLQRRGWRPFDSRRCSRSIKGGSIRFASIPRGCQVRRRMRGVVETTVGRPAPTAVAFDCRRARLPEWRRGPGKSVADVHRVLGADGPEKRGRVHHAARPRAARRSRAPSCRSNTSSGVLTTSASRCSSIPGA